MKKRKITAVIIAIALVIASMPGLGVQADSIGKEAQACKDLGVLIGTDASGVTSQYLSTTPTRIQAFIIFLRLKGLYDDATDFQGGDNFNDADEAGWAKNYMSYGKENPDLGWQGYPDGSFAPADKINGQAFYKVMLETLGYRQGIDFTYDETLKFAQGIGLVSKADDIAKLKSFTVNDVAKGICGALNTKPQGSDKKLITVMVEENIITSEKAVAAGFELDTKEAKVVSFNAASNNKIEIEFDQDILLQKADVEIAQLDGNTRLSVLSVESEGKEAVITTTEAKSFNAYEITVNTLVPTNGLVIRDYKKKFVAMPKDTVKPTVRYELLGNTEILLTFSEEVSRSTAEDLSNYSIEHDVTIKSAELGDSGKTVLLKTSSMSAGDFYRLTVEGVCDIAGNSIDRYREAFDGAKSDTKMPSITNVKSENSSTVTVTFSERIDKATAEDTDNYIANNNLSITDAELDESGKEVTLGTSAQQSGTTYKLTISNIEDTWGNEMYRKEYAFVADSSKPSASVVVISNNEVKVTFTKQMDEESAEDIDNYSVDKGLEVKDAILDGDEKSVTLITSSQTSRTVYTLTISGVQDAWGNTMSTTSGKFGGTAEDTRDLTFTAKSSGGYLIITFNKRVVKEKAEDVFNYVLDDRLGYAAKAELDDTGRVVTLLTAPHVSGQIYTVTVENIEDIFGNEIDSDDSVATKKFAGISGSGDGNSEGTLSLETVATVNVNTIDLIFSDELTDEELDDMDIELDVPDGYDDDLPSELEYYKYFVGSEKNVRVQFKTDSSKNPEVFEYGNMYEVEVKGIDRLDNDDDANVKQFAGTNTENEEPEVLEVNALNSTAVEVTFSEPVKGITKSQFSIEDDIVISGVSAEDEDEIVEKVVLYINSSTELDDDDYKLYIKSGIEDAAGNYSVKIGSGSSRSYIEFEGTDEENDPPTVDSDITIIDSYTIQLEFNEEIKDISSSSFNVRNTSKSSSNLNVSKAILSDDRKQVTLYLNSRYTGLDSDDEYKLVINSSVKDLQGLGVDSDEREIEFDGVDTEPEELEIIASFISDNNRTITLITNREITVNSLDMDDFELEGAGYYESSSDEVEYDENSITIILRNELDNDETLTIEISDTTRAKIKDYNNQELSTEEIEIDTK